MKPVKIGIIGCGIIGRTHAEAANKSSRMELVAVADMNAEAAQKLAAELGVPKFYGNAIELLNDAEIGAVVLAVPTCGRAELAMQAFANGKHVLIEKPAGMNAQEIEKMLEVRGDLVGACCSSRHQFLDSTIATMAFMESGKLGDIRVLHCRVMDEIKSPPKVAPPSWRLSRSLNGGGILVNWGCYDLDYLLSLTGWSVVPQKVFASSWQIPTGYREHVAPGSDAETHFMALINCENDITFSIERGEYMPVRNEQAWQIVGTKGALRLNLSVREEHKSIEFDEITEQGIKTTVVWQGKDDASRLFEGAIHNFAAAIQNHVEPATSLRRALVIQSITDAIYESSNSRVAVTVTPQTTEKKI